MDWSFYRVFTNTYSYRIRGSLRSTRSFRLRLRASGILTLSQLRFRLLSEQNNSEDVSSVVVVLVLLLAD